MFSANKLNDCIFLKNIFKHLYSMHILQNFKLNLLYVPKCILFLNMSWAVMAKKQQTLKMKLSLNILKRLLRSELLEKWSLAVIKKDYSLKNCQIKVLFTNCAKMDTKRHNFRLT